MDHWYRGNSNLGEINNHFTALKLNIKKEMVKLELSQILNCEKLMMPDSSDVFMYLF